MDHQIEVNEAGNTVWVNSGIDGSCIGRFSKKYGMDVHKTGTQQLAGEGECIHCTHEPAGKEEWHLFIQLMLKHYDVVIPSSLLEF